MKQRILAGPVRRRNHSGLETRHLSHGSLAIPRTNVLANVTAENVTPNAAAKFFRDHTAVFDREVGDAPAGVHYVRLRKGCGWAGVETTGTGAAQITGGQTSGRDGRKKFKRGNEHSQEKPRAQLLIEQERIFSKPAEPRVLCEYTLLHG